jgi:voltage-gated potassium channel
MAHLRRRLIFITVAIMATLAGGTIGFRVIENYPWFDAFYMTLITVTTVGYSEVHELSKAGRIFNSFLIFFGVVILLLAVGNMTQTVIELELNQFFGKRRTKNMIDKLEGHFILCGFGRVGRGAAEELRQANMPFVVVDNDEDKIERAMHDGMLGVVGDASRDETLKDVGVDKARGLIATLASDADNLFLILTAKTLNPNLQLTARVAEESSEQKMRRAGADHVFAPYNSTGHRMVQALLKPHVMQFLDVTTQATMGINVGIEQVQIEESCKYCGRALWELQIARETGVIVLAVRRAGGEMMFNPSLEMTVAAGDHLIAMGRPQGLQKLEKLLAASGNGSGK